MNLEIKGMYKNKPAVKQLARLVEIALNDSGQSVKVRRFLLHLFNSDNTMNLVDILCGCDADITEACLDVMRLRYESHIEPHSYFLQGDETFRYLLRMEKTEAEEAL